MTLHISRLAVYPLKSAAGTSLPEARLTSWGLEWDRRWMLVDAGGQFLSQRKLPRMALIQAGVEKECLRVSAPGRPEMLAVPDNPQPVKVTVWNDEVWAETVSATADAWFEDFLGVKARLVFFPTHSQRPVDKAWAGDGHFTSFSDGFPFLVASQASLDQLSAWWGRPVDWRRFRPNIVIGGAKSAFAEDEWSKIQISGTVFALVKPCSRCVIPSLDPDTAEKDASLQALLVQKRRASDGKIYLGQNAVLSMPGGADRLRVGQSVVV